MRRIRNLGLFAIIASLDCARSRRRPAPGRPAGDGDQRRHRVRRSRRARSSRTDTRCPVFAEGLASPRFMDVSADGVLFVAERGADRVVALPDRDADGRADETIEVGRGFESAHSVAFEPDGRLLVAGETRLFRLSPGRRSSGGGSIRRPGGPDHRRALHPDGRRAAGRAVAPLGRVDLQRLCRGRSAARGDQPRAVRGWLEPGLHDRPPECGGRVGRSGDGPRVGHQHGTRLAGRRPAAGDRLRGDRRRRRRLAEVPRRGPGRSGVRRRGRLRRCCRAGRDVRGAHRTARARWHGRATSSSPSTARGTARDKAGYALWWLPWDGEPAGEAEPFATGFLPEGAQDALGRPAGLAVGADGALYVSDDKGGFIYRIARR